MPTIALCSSLNFYRQVVEIEGELDKLGYNVIIPYTARQMKKTGNYDSDSRRTWLQNPEDYHIKADLMRKHFAEIDKADAILIVNYEKHGQANYIGGNVLMEMTLAFHARKPIVILNEVPEDSKFYEELMGMEPIVLHGKLQDITKQLPAK